MSYRFAVSAALALAAPDISAQGYRYFEEDFPFQMAAITMGAPDEANKANKGIAIDVGNGATALFDIDMVRLAGGWTGGFITEDGVTFNGGHGNNPKADGDVRFGVNVLHGWAPAGGAFEDTRPEPFGPIDKSVATWTGIYPVGQEVVLGYTVLGSQFYEQPGSLTIGDDVAFTRTILVEESPRTRAVGLVASLTGYGDPEALGGAVVAKQGDGENAVEDPNVLVVALAPGAPEGVALGTVAGHVVVEIDPEVPAGSSFTLVVGSGPEWSAAVVTEAADRAFEVADFGEGGPAQWREAVEFEGQLSADETPDGAYVVDRIPPPVENPWGRRVRLGGFDFFTSDPTKAAFSTWDGDIWLLEGIDDDLDSLRWTRFASGLFEPLGLKIVDDEIYVSGRVGLLKITDVNGDGWADAYESFNHDLTSSVGFHEFVFDLHTDAEGNFYFAKAGPVRGGGRGFGSRPFEGDRFGHVSAHAGTVVKVSADGSQFDVYATGFRAPNGIGVGPDGQVTTGDNEGTWVPACPINWVREGGFHGVEDLAHLDPVPEFIPPLCWLDKSEFDNSGGGQVWVTSDRWGPFQGELLHMSYGQCKLYLVMKQEVDGLMQGGVVQIPVSFASSAMRARFNEGDGQLYVAGLRGWQTRAANLSGFDRIRYTGKDPLTARDFKVDSEGVHLTFTQPLDEETATDTGNYAASQWNYLRSSNYGSARYSVEFEGERGEDEVIIDGVELSEDGKTVTLKIDGLVPVDQLRLEYNLKSAAGAELRQTGLFTIHRIPEA